MNAQSVLDNRVLVLNRNWQAIGTVSAEQAMCDLYRGACVGIDTNEMRPVKWEDWVKLPVEGKDSLKTMHGPVRVPTVICKAQYAKMPKHRPKLNTRSIRERDGNRCQYTGRMLQPEEGNLDHVLPRSRGGRDAWTNLVWSDKAVNHQKSNKTPQEAGLRLLRLPSEPKALPACVAIRAQHPDWQMFLMS